MAASVNAKNKQHTHTQRGKNVLFKWNFQIAAQPPEVEEGGAHAIQQPAWR